MGGGFGSAGCRTGTGCTRAGTIAGIVCCVRRGGKGTRENRSLYIHNPPLQPELPLDLPISDYQCLKIQIEGSSTFQISTRVRRPRGMLGGFSILRTMVARLRCALIKAS